MSARCNRPADEARHEQEGGHEGHTLMRCDLHVHSRHSGAADLGPLGLLADESYSDPRAVYGEARRRGMDLVTLTDHNTIAGAVEIASLPPTAPFLPTRAARAAQALTASDIMPLRASTSVALESA